MKGYLPEQNNLPGTTPRRKMDLPLPQHPLATHSPSVEGGASGAASSRCDEMVVGPILCRSCATAVNL